LPEFMMCSSCFFLTSFLVLYQRKVRADLIIDVKISVGGR
jgi:hypothetical protein